MPVNARHDMKMMSKDTQPIFEIAQAIEVGGDLFSADVQLILMSTNLRHSDRIGLPSIAKRHLAADLVSNLWSATQGRGIELGPLNSQPSFISFDGRMDQSHICVILLRMLAVCRQAIQPRCVELSKLYFGTAEK